MEHDVGRDNAWPYRDYVINALNRDVSWSDFIKQQIAVDVFEPGRSDLIPALGFLGAGTFDMSTYSTGPKTFDLIDRDDMVTQTLTAFTSTTINCARCHAHKFDPISQADYYALQAVFAGIIKGDVRYDADASTAAERARLNLLLHSAATRDKNSLLGEEASRLTAAWLSEQSAAVEWHDLRLTSFISTDGADLKQIGEGVLLASGPSPDTDTYVLAGSTDIKRVTAMKVEVLPHDTLPMKGPGRCQNGNLHLSEVAVKCFQAASGEGRPVPIVAASADFNQEGWGIHRAIDGDNKTAWGIFPEVAKKHYAVFEFKEPIEVGEADSLTVSLRQLHGGSHLIGALSVSVTDAPPKKAAALPVAVTSALSKSESERTEEDRITLAAHAVAVMAQTRMATLPEPAKVYAVGKSVDIPSGNGKVQPAVIATPKEVFVLQRGEIDKPREVIGPGALSVLKHAASRFELPTGADEKLRRAALAEWLAHRDNVLTWRSIVNRIWHYHFGRGLCDTPSDFGRMGGKPSHPELIDWLSVWFRDKARGSLKQLHRIIVTSRTYRQSSAVHQAGATVDTDNRLLWRQNRRRLDADTFHDAVLSVAGTMDLTMGGPSIQQFKQSPGVQATPVLDYTAYDWSAPGGSRRSIYRYVWRGIPDPLMTALDFPDLGLFAPVRGESVSPLQALSLSNNAFVLHQCERMGAMIDAQSSSPRERSRFAAMRIWGREPASDEVTPLGDYAARHGTAALCRVLFNSSEFLFVP
ncbi:MAG: DUF1553 domain-containing protein [Pirellulales bacterium]